MTTYVGGSAACIADLLAAYGLEVAAVPVDQRVTWDADTGTRCRRTPRDELAQLACPCCGCLTLPSHGAYDICPVCWEDDFTVDPEDDVNPNNMSLFDARANLAAWGAVDSELVHWTRPPRPDEAPEGTPHRGELPYDRWPTLPVATGVRFGWVGPASPASVQRDGFLILDDGRRAGLRVHADEAAEMPRVQPADHVGRDRDGQFDVWLEDGPNTEPCSTPCARASPSRSSRCCPATRTFPCGHRTAST